jgi:hypothetical protein
MHRLAPTLFLAATLLIVSVLGFNSCTHKADISGLPTICFDTQVLPVYKNSCGISGCHDGSGGERMAMTSFAEIRSTVTPFHPESSRSYQAITDKWGEQMPPSAPLSKDQRTIIRLWIEQGAQETLCDTTGGGGGGGGRTGTERACFTRDILPVLVSHCGTAGCHDATTHKEGYNFTSYAYVMSAVNAGNPTKSRLYRQITASGEDKMPPATQPQLTAAQIDSIYKWISYGAKNETCAAVCDTINPVTYSGTISPIIQNTCVGCHSGSNPSGGVYLNSYANIASVASSGMLLKSLKGDGVTRMPNGGALSACVIREFEIWINNGYLNN